MPRCRIESLGVSVPRRSWRRLGSLDHAVHAGKQALSTSHYHNSDVAVLINAGVYRDRHYAEPAFACFIQEKLDINAEFQGRATLSFDLLNGGCGLLNAAQVLSNMILSRTVQVGMIVASEANADKHPDPSYHYQSSGAAAILDVSPLRDRGFGEFAFVTLDQYQDLCSSVVSLATPGGRLLVRHQDDLEHAYAEAAHVAWQRLLSQSGLTSDNIDWVACSQVSPAFLDALAQTNDIPRSRVLDVPQSYGDTLTTSWLLAFTHAQAQGRIAEGSTGVFLACGSGVSAGAAVYYA